MQLLFLERNLLDNRFFKVMFGIASLMILLAHKCTNFWSKSCPNSVIILFIYIPTVVCQGAWLPWKPCSLYSTRTKLFELNRSAAEWRCLVWKIIMGELILMNLCRPALKVLVFFETQCTLSILLRYVQHFWLGSQELKNWRSCNQDFGTNLEINRLYPIFR